MEDVKIFGDIATQVGVRLSSENKMCSKCGIVILWLPDKSGENVLSYCGCGKPKFLNIKEYYKKNDL